MCDELEQEFEALADAYASLVTRCEIHERTLEQFKFQTIQNMDAFGLRVVSPEQKRVDARVRKCQEISDYYRKAGSIEATAVHYALSPASIRQMLKEAGDESWRVKRPYNVKRKGETAAMHNRHARTA